MENLLDIVVRNRERAKLPLADAYDFDRIDLALRIFLRRVAFHELGVKRRAAEIANDVLEAFKTELSLLAVKPNVNDAAALALKLWGNLSPRVWLLDKVRSAVAGSNPPRASFLSRLLRFLFRSSKTEPKETQDRETGVLRETCKIDRHSVREEGVNLRKGLRPCIHRCDVLFFVQIGLKADTIADYLGVPRRSISRFVTTCNQDLTKPVPGAKTASF